MDADVRKQLQDALDQLDTGRDLVEASRLFRQYQDRIVRSEVRALSPGDQVTWFHRGRKHLGRVRRLNHKTVDVTGTDGRVWRIGPTALTRVSKD